MWLLDHQQQHDAQHRAIGHQLQKADLLQPVHRPAGEGAVGILPLFLRVPLGQAGGEENNNGDLCDLRRLECGTEQQKQPQPPLGPVDGHAQGGQHQHQQHDGPQENGDGQPPQILIVHPGNEEHDHGAQHGELQLTPDIEQRIVLHRLAGVVIRRGVGRGEDHDQANAHQHHGQHQKGQIHRPPGQLLGHGQITLSFSSQWIHLLSLSKT